MPEPASGHPWAFFLFGSLRIVRHGKAQAAPPDRCQGLLALLLLQAGSLRRDHLAALLFPDLSAEEGRRRISDRLWLLRHALPDLPLQIGREEVGLPAAARWLDVEQFLAGIQSGEERSILAAIELYRGDLLPGVFDEWLLVEREGLYLRYANALHQMASLRSERGDHAGALPMLQRLALLDPLDEPVTRLLMRAYLALGRRGLALAAFERFQETLRRELGADPEPATLALAATLRDVTRPRVPRAASAMAEMSAGELLRQARTALRSGDRDLAEASLARLERSAGKTTNLDASLLRFDLHFLNDPQDVEALLPELPAAHAGVLLRRARLLLANGEIAPARELVEQSLLTAGREEQDELGLDALLLLGEIALAGGDWSLAMNAADKTLVGARRTGSPYHEMLALALKGEAAGLHGLKSDAAQAFRQAEALARQHGYRVGLLRVLEGIAWQQRVRGEYHRALQEYGKALELSRDLHLPRREAAIQQGMATAYDYLGDRERSLQALLRAGELFETIGDQAGRAENYYHLAYALPYHNEQDIPRAIRYAEMAVAYFLSGANPLRLATCWAALGYNLWLHREPAAAVQAYERALEGFLHLNASDYIPEVYSYLGLAHLDLGDIDRALDLTATALIRLAQSDVYDIASELYYARGVVLEAAGEPDRAGEAYLRAYEAALTAAERIEEEQARRAFFERDPSMRRLIRKVAALGLVDPAAAQTDRQQVTGPAGLPIEIEWTVDAGAADLALKNARGSIALRQARLKRLIHEAHQQGGQPTNAQLAAALGVSVRTVQRDLAELGLERYSRV